MQFDAINAFIWLNALCFLISRIKVYYRLIHLEVLEDELVEAREICNSLPLQNLTGFSFVIRAIYCQDCVNFIFDWLNCIECNPTTKNACFLTAQLYFKGIYSNMLDCLSLVLQRLKRPMWTFHTVREFRPSPYFKTHFLNENLFEKVNGTSSWKLT